MGDGLHGLKAVRAAAAERWLLDRFAQETAKRRWLLRERVRRRAGSKAWRDTLVMAISSLWLLLQGDALTTDMLTTTLVPAHRAGSSLSGVVEARRLCLGNLSGYEAFCVRREQLRPGPEQSTGTVQHSQRWIAAAGSSWTGAAHRGRTAEFTACACSPTSWSR